MLLIGKPSIFIGPLYHGYVTINQRVKSTMFLVISGAKDLMQHSGIQPDVGYPFWGPEML